MTVLQPQSLEKKTNHHKISYVHIPTFLESIVKSTEPMNAWSGLVFAGSARPQPVAAGSQPTKRPFRVSRGSCEAGGPADRGVASGLHKKPNTPELRKMPEIILGIPTGF